MSTDEGAAGSVEVHLDAETTLVRLIGEIDFALISGLDAAFAEAVSRDVPTQVDAYQVTFLDSIGVGFIARLASAERRHGRALSVLGSSRTMRETLVLSGVADLLEGSGPHSGGREQQPER